VKRRYGADVVCEQLELVYAETIERASCRA
jgi:hypothetical protein